MQRSERQRRQRRSVPLLVFAVLALGAMGSAAVVDRVVDDQEDELLERRTGEAALLVGSFFTQPASSLPLIGAVASMAPGAEQAMLDQLLGDQTVGSIELAVARETGVEVTAASGDGGPATGPLDGERLALAERALRSSGVVSTVFGDGDGRRLVFAAAVPPGGPALVLQEMPFESAVLERSDTDLFNDLDGVVYASPTADPDALLFATTDELPLGGDVVERRIDIGADEWLVVATAREPLVGSFARNAPWFVLGVGVLTAALTALLAEVLSRRRTYAVQLVEDRTAELREALAAQERLEDGQRRAREAAEAANRSKSEFLSRMSHELRTPLNAVLGFAQLLDEADLDPADREAVRQILRGGRHLLDLINEVLDITRIETGTFQLSPEPVLVSEILDSVTELTAPLAAQAGIHLVGAASAPCGLHVLADRQRLTQIMLNLVSNAIKYNRARGTVSLSCEAAGAATMRIKVHDTGPGIRSEDRALLFTPFERLGAEHTTVEGTGIGLTVSRRLAEAMGGSIDLESVPGQGSTFWVELPIVEGPVERYERLGGDGAAASVPPARRTRMVLYIEDNLANVRLVERVLAYDEGLELVTAMQGRLGVDLAREHRPSLILLDLHLPDIEGDEVLRQLRDHPETSAIPVAIISADATPGRIRRLLAEGAHTYLTKPLDVAELRSLVEGLPAPTA